MNVRGAAGKRPVSPSDPTLIFNPVPPTRSFPLQSFGPGAATDFQPQSLQEIDEKAKTNPITYYGKEIVYPDMSESLNLSHQSTRRLLEEVERWEAFTWQNNSNNEKTNYNPTWGFYVFITSYSETCLAQIPKAMKNWIRAVEGSLKYACRAAYADEALKRFKLDVILDELILANASEDRVREEFRSFIRGLDLYDPPEEPLGLAGYGESDFMVPPARNVACFILDENDVSMLAELKFSEDPTQNFGEFERKKLRLIDGTWRRPQFSHKQYRGIRYCPIHSLGRIYQIITLDLNVLEDGFNA
ncbi:hypothetical protein BDV34DRAFT_226262 [Aspergillus parasiticus]|uniref:Uncharacterized protein n=1 Tax=Aspergillus parasiticus TaxID=5067 RepID=A0A5N6DHP1_ASPPA|nr:hypothetical protein BDV34DRAFT_226262 [Aspergillus parasiticus]